MSSVTGYLGPEGSYSHIAAKKLAEGEIAPFPSFFLLVKALKEGAVDAIVLPVENSLNGGVTQNLDLLQETDGICAVAETLVKIEHRLVTLKGADLSKITTIYSHQQALGQCAHYLDAVLPKAERISTRSTAHSLALLDAHSAGIVGAHIRAEGVVLSGENIADVKNNFTQFFLLRRRSEGIPSKGGTVFFSAVCEHRPGSLLALLECFSARGINLTRIESRPIPRTPGEYRFFIEIDAQPQTARPALEAARRVCSSFRILGVY